MSWLGGLALAAGLLCGFGTARAGNIQGYIWQNQQAAAEDATLAQVTSLGGTGSANARFVNSGALSYDSNGSSDYTPALFLGNPTFTNTSGFAPNASLDNTYIYFTGHVSLNAGSNSFFIHHDDGYELNIDGVGGNSNPNNGAGDDSFTLTAPSAGIYTFELSYGEAFGAPAAITVQVNGQDLVDPTPEPASLALLGTGAVTLLGYALRRRRKATA
jgi:hypothetical protein